MAKKKTCSYEYSVLDKDGNWVNVRTLTIEQREKLGRQGYKIMAKSLGLIPISELDKEMLKE